MKIRFERTGGLTAIPVTFDIDTASLSAQEAEQVQNLVSIPDFIHLAQINDTPSGAPDRFMYRLTIEIDDLKYTVVSAEKDMPATLKPLVEFLTKMARGHR